MEGFYNLPTCKSRGGVVVWRPQSRYCRFGQNKITYLRYRNRDQDPLCFFVTMTIPSTRLLCSGWLTQYAYRHPSSKVIGTASSTSKIAAVKPAATASATTPRTQRDSRTAIRTMVLQSIALIARNKGVIRRLHPSLKRL